MTDWYDAPVLPSRPGWYLDESNRPWNLGHDGIWHGNSNGRAVEDCGPFRWMAVEPRGDGYRPYWEAAARMVTARDGLDYYPYGSPEWCSKALEALAAYDANLGEAMRLLGFTDTKETDDH